jgi:DNA-directed RNA polymerase specialized sigma24 family protein
VPTSRDIDQETWKHARQCLVYYFSRRGLADAEDLANDTLLALWVRSDYVFEREEDFLRVCYGFADNVRRQGFRQAQKDFLSLSDEQIVPAPGGSLSGLRGAEIPVFLREVQTAAEDRLRENEREYIDAVAADELTDAPTARDYAAANRFRVGLHRARRKLSKLTGWDQSEDSDSPGSNEP